MLLQARNPRNARELARLLEVTPRTIYRDVDALGTAGIPIYAERGSHGGIALTEGYRQSLTHFSGEELHALFVSSSQPLTDLGVAAADGALLKLAGTLSDVQRRDAQKARERVLLDQQKWYRTAQPAAVLATLRAATWEDRRVHLGYRDRNGTATSREVEPLGLVSKAGVWYVIAREPGGTPHSFRAERIIDVRILAERFERPADFNLETYWYASTAALERPVMVFEALIRLRGETASLFGYWDAEIIDSDLEHKNLPRALPG
ncbi:MAG: YafY family protein [Candidatus Velthaea sp.]